MSIEQPENLIPTRRVTAVNGWGSKFPFQQPNYLPKPQWKSEERFTLASERMRRGRSLFSDKPLVLVTNRPPLDVRRDTKNGSLGFGFPTGGLTTAMHSVIYSLPVRPICISANFPSKGAMDLNQVARLQRENKLELPVELHPVRLDPDPSKEQELFKSFYNDAANGFLWFAMHMDSSRAVFKPASWPNYLKVNSCFAKTIAPLAKAGHPVWIHDYHLLTAATEVRREVPQAALAFFLHIPWPDKQTFGSLFPPEVRKAILEGMLSYNLVGVHTSRYRSNLIDCIQEHGKLLNLARIDDDVVELQNGRRVDIRVFPISISYDMTREMLNSHILRRAAKWMEDKFEDLVKIVSIDRLDPTKGIHGRVKAIEHLLTSNKYLIGEFQLIIYAAPSRGDIASYRAYAEDIQREIDRVNAAFQRECPNGKVWRPIHYRSTKLHNEAVLGFLRAAEMVIVNPDIDGMNLVIKEAIAISDKPTCFILSSGAGAAEMLNGNLSTVAPRDINGLSQAIGEGLAEMRTPNGQKRLHDQLTVLKDQLAFLTVENWAESFLRAFRLAAFDK